MTSQTGGYAAGRNAVRQRLHTMKTEGAGERGEGDADGRELFSGAGGRAGTVFIWDEEDEDSWEDELED